MTTDNNPVTNFAHCSQINIQLFLDLADRVIELENKIIELQTRIDWIENYDKKNSNNSANDNSV